MYFTILLSTLIVSIISCFFYKKIWSMINLKKVPTGYGYILIFFILIYSFLLKLPLVNIKVFGVILLFSSIYWIDDIKSLSFIFRLLIQFFCGLTLAFLILKENNFLYSQSFLIILILSGFLNIFLTNIINFYDGLDLNISIFTIILSFVLIFLTSFEKSNYLGIVILGFILGFMFFNFKPNNIFFGDSGCFVISSFVSFLIIKNIYFFNFEIIYLLIPFLLPIVDVCYVVLLRIYLKESLLTRNYHHIYHKMGEKFKNKIYLLPQIINALVIFIIGIFIVPNNHIANVRFILISILSTLILYFFIQFFIIRRR